MKSLPVTKYAWSRVKLVLLWDSQKEEEDKTKPTYGMNEFSLKVYSCLSNYFHYFCKNVFFYNQQNNILYILLEEKN